MIKLRDYLQKNSVFISESRIEKSDRNVIYSILEKPRNYQFILKSYSKDFSTETRKVKVSLIDNDKLVFLYKTELYDFTDSLVDILDTLHLKFEPQPNDSMIKIEVSL